MGDKIVVYVAHRMTGRYQDELVQEAQLTKRVLENYGFTVLDPIISENVPNTHELLNQVNAEQLAKYWARDKEMIRDADILLDYMACNQSDGVAKELGYARFCLWKPVVRVFPKLGLSISRIEDDHITETLSDAVGIMMNLYGSYEKLRRWRQAMWDRCFTKWVAEQNRMNERYNVKVSNEGPTCILNIH
jgi:nucleoside 2-deoxyribosyltransferase